MSALPSPEFDRIESRYLVRLLNNLLYPDLHESREGACRFFQNRVEEIDI